MKLKLMKQLFLWLGSLLRYAKGTRPQRLFFSFFSLSHSHAIDIRTLYYTALHFCFSSSFIAIIIVDYHLFSRFQHWMYLRLRVCIVPSPSQMSVDTNFPCYGMWSVHAWLGFASWDRLFFSVQQTQRRWRRQQRRLRRWSTWKCY